MTEKGFSFLKRKISRRRFLKKLGLGIGGLAAAGVAYKYLWSDQAVIQPVAQISDKAAPSELWKWSKEASNYIELGAKDVQCRLCPNRCNLKPDERSVCRVRVNKDGKLYSLVYGNPCAVHVDPIEKKPLFHFLPTSKAFSIATAGCNFTCLNCQNWEISQSYPEDVNTTELFPEQVVEQARSNNCLTIAYTYGEPVIFYEYMYDTCKIAHENGLKNLLISNGYIEKQPLEDLCKVLDAANIDLKSFDEKIYNKLNSGSLQPVLDTLKTLKKNDVWIEITVLIVPGYIDEKQVEKICSWIVKEIGVDVPVHFSRFHPQYQLQNLSPTPVSMLEKAVEIAKDKGIRYVYVGNLPGNKNESTYCHSCGKILIERRGYYILQNNIVEGKCKFCNESIPGVWTL